MPCKREAVQIINMPIPPTFSVYTAAILAGARTLLYQLANAWAPDAHERRSRRKRTGL
jgi:hypothetical protein